MLGEVTYDVVLVWSAVVDVFLMVSFVGFLNGLLAVWTNASVLEGYVIECVG